MLSVLLYSKTDACITPPKEPFALQIAAIQKSCNQKSGLISTASSYKEFENKITIIENDITKTVPSDECINAIMSIASCTSPCHLDYHITTQAYKRFQQLDLFPIIEYLDTYSTPVYLFKDEKDMWKLLKEFTTFSSIQQELALHNPSVTFLARQKNTKKDTKRKEHAIEFKMLQNFFFATWVSQVDGASLGNMPIQFLWSARIRQGLLALAKNTKQKKLATKKTLLTPIDKVESVEKTVYSAPDNNIDRTHIETESIAETIMGNIDDANKSEMPLNPETMTQLNNNVINTEENEHVDTLTQAQGQFPPQPNVCSEQEQKTINRKQAPYDKISIITGISLGMLTVAGLVYSIMHFYWFTSNYQRVHSPL